MRKTVFGAATVAVFLWSPMAAMAADPLANLPFNIAGGTPNLDARLRYESVDQENMADDAEALTIRARLGYTTGKWNDIDGQLEFETIGIVGKVDNYNPAPGVAPPVGNPAYPAVADQEIDELNQAWIRYSGLPKTTVKYGRQRLILDNARFIGNVGWRQNEQTYDGWVVQSGLIPKTTVNLAYLSNVNSFRTWTVGPKVTDDVSLESGLIANIAFTPIKALTLVAYDYELDFSFDAAPGTVNNPRRDTRTLGLRASGSVPVGKFSVPYAAEYAGQDGIDDSPDGVDADYYLIEAGLGYGKVKGLVGYEVLGGDGVYGFQTPLATLHAFQGWADLFLVTPANGIEDLYVSVTLPVAKGSFTAAYHDYQSDEASVDYGDEINLIATYPVIENLVIGAKYAAYSADEFPTAGVPAAPYDTDKLWAWVEYKF